MSNADSSARDESRRLLLELLSQRGYSEAEVRKIMARVEEYESETLHDSVFDSIENGRLNLGGIIKEALGDDSAS